MTPTIRTHTTTVMDIATVPDDWEPGTPVLVVAGLPEGAELVAHGPGDDGYDGLANGWEVAASIIAPKPVPAPPATAREIAADELRVAEQHGYGSADIGPTAVADRIIDRLAVAGLLVEAPTGDDEPPRHEPWERAEAIYDEEREAADEPQADTPTPAACWSVDPETGALVFGDRRMAHNTVRCSLHAVDPETGKNYLTAPAFTALVDLVRRDGTDPGPDLTPLFDALDADARARQTEARLAAAERAGLCGDLDVIDHLADVAARLTAERDALLAACSEVLVTVSESLECDGGSITAYNAAGDKLPIRRASERRVYRTAYVTWAITVGGTQ